MKNIHFRTNKDVKYLYYPNKKQISYINPQFLSKPYYIKQEDFLKNNGFYAPFKPLLSTEYDPNAIKSNLANLRMLVLEVTDGCNLACEYCGYGKLYNNYDKRSNKKIDFNQIKVLIDYLYKLWISPLNVSFNNIITIGFYGGEPLLSFDIIKGTIEYLERLNLENIKFQYNMTTNSMLLGKYMDFLAEKDFSLLLSLDGNKMNNSYRVTQNGKDSFDIIVRNIKLLQKKHPAYFQERVNFNSVLHNKNSEKEIISFIRNEFGKVPRISAINSNGIDESQVEEFYRLFKPRNYINFEKKDKSIDEELLETSPDFTLLSNFYDTFLSNTYNSYTELFSDEINKTYIPTGTCHPFSRKLFLTVNGKILPCERIGQNEALGYIKDGKVDIDFERVAKLYSQKYTQIINQCENCINWSNCSYCVFYIKEKNGKLICDRFSPETKAASYCARYVSLLEEKPLLINKLVKQTFKY